ncbi:3-keto-5-aminohexanoate cleavage protein [Ihubacter massiliensis]|uniref:3-keto-5-aminohexanoate cleavage protein n=1 Tax=Hominibacterium faecale TaxID=2839743 RepID=A0A9J6QI57_9FIRM|nr:MULTISPECIES: 3-keto-5-aminohexanoate cleavage protein [Eubacteriales Family XIII. Incertae Sedis]MCO7122922.1 3-keto-5-aminohexanoate cleavage protein [Ihubacter massiliensis]MCU7377184.1 3-keto-5-aminohexanoate cleavage protein [Hominibacterium faecale]
MSNLDNKVIVTAALTGAVTPPGYNIPETPEQIAKDAYECWKAGAAIVHLHMRDEQGLGTMDEQRFRETIRLIRTYEDCDVVINCTSSGDARVSGGDAEGNAIRMKHMKTLDGIEMGSYDAGSFNWMPGGVFMNTPKFLEELGDVYMERGIKPEYEIFDTGMLDIVEYFTKKGHLPQDRHYQFCLGILGGMPATVENLLYLTKHIPEGATWSAFGVGAAHLPIMYAALALGGNIRVGLEDNVVFGRDDNGQKIMATNKMLVERAVKAVETFGKKPATSAEARQILGMKPFER